jgi:hypothetical protein
MSEITQEKIDQAYNYVIEQLLKSDEIRKDYDKYIIPDITFKEWVQGMADTILGLPSYDLTRPYKNEDINTKE